MRLRPPPPLLPWRAYDRVNRIRVDTPPARYVSQRFCHTGQGIARRETAPALHHGSRRIRAARL